MCPAGIIYGYLVDWCWLEKFKTRFFNANFEVWFLYPKAHHFYKTLWKFQRQNLVAINWSCPHYPRISMAGFGWLHCLFPADDEKRWRPTSHCCRVFWIILSLFEQVCSLSNAGRNGENGGNTEMQQRLRIDDKKIMYKYTHQWNHLTESFNISLPILKFQDVGWYYDFMTHACNTCFGNFQLCHWAPKLLVTATGLGLTYKVGPKNPPVISAPITPMIFYWAEISPESESESHSGIYFGHL